MKMNEEEKNKRKVKRSIIISVIIALLTTIYFHIRLGLGVDGFMELMGPSWGYTILLVAIFFAVFVAMFLLFKGAGKVKVELTEEEKKRRKSIRVEFIFFLIDAGMTGLFVRLNWKQITAGGTLLGIAEVAAFFAIVWFVFEFFNHFKVFPERIFKFIIGFFIKVCIPMLFLLIILLGAYQAKYGYDDLFRSQIQHNANIFAENMKIAYENVITAFYDIGQSNPNLWIWLPIAAFFVMTLWLLYSTFTRPEKKDDQKSAQELIQEAVKEDEEEQAYERGEKKRPMLHNFFDKLNNAMKSKEDKEKEEKEKLAEKNMKYKIYDIKFTQLKGGNG